MVGPRCSVTGIRLFCATYTKTPLISKMRIRVIIFVV